MVIEIDDPTQPNPFPCIVVRCYPNGKGEARGEG
jgi:hypothetical protein